MLDNIVISSLFVASAYGVYYFGYQLYCIFAGIPIEKLFFKLPASDFLNDSDPPFGNALTRRKSPHPHSPGSAEAQVVESNTCSQIP